MCVKRLAHNMSKLNATQNVIRNKFKEIHANRLEREHDVEQTLKPITTAAAANTSLSPSLASNSLPWENKGVPQTGLLLNNRYSIRADKLRTIKANNNDPNALCEDLRKLLSSTSSSSSSSPLANAKQLVDAILEELRDLNIIV